MKHSVIIVIPVRMGSSRYPGKPLVDLDGMPMVGHCYFRAVKSGAADRVIVATCDTEIQDYVESIGGEVIMTSDGHDRATDRTAEALETLERKGSFYDVVIMYQGDEPLIDPAVIGLLSNQFEDREVSIANIASRFRDKSQFEDYNNVKVVVNSHGDAMYFSREPIPSTWKNEFDEGCLNQVGVIGFRRDALLEFNSQPQSRLEQIESVDMLRVLENSGRIRIVVCDNLTLGVDVEEEAVLASEFLKQDPISKSYR